MATDVTLDPKLPQNLDAERSVRLEWTIIVLIAVEIMLSVFQIFMSRPQ